MDSPLSSDATESDSSEADSWKSCPRGETASISGSVDGDMAAANEHVHQQDGNDEKESKEQAKNLSDSDEEEASYSQGMREESNQRRNQVQQQAVDASAVFDSDNSDLDQVPLAEFEQRARSVSRVTDSDGSPDGKKSLPSDKAEANAKMPAKKQEARSGGDDKSTTEDRNKSAKHPFNDKQDYSDSEDDSMGETNKRNDGADDVMDWLMENDAPLREADCKMPAKKRMVTGDGESSDSDDDLLEEDRKLSPKRPSRQNEGEEIDWLTFGDNGAPVSDYDGKEIDLSFLVGPMETKQGPRIRTASTAAARGMLSKEIATANGKTAEQVETHALPRGGRRPKGKLWDKCEGKWVDKRNLAKGAVESSDILQHPPKKRAKANNGKAMPQSSSFSDSQPTSRPSSHTGLDPKRRKQDTKIGTRVYAEWKDGFYYWGVVTDIKRKKFSHYDQYSVLFHDLDFLESVSLGDFITIHEYRTSSIYTDNPPRIPKMCSTRYKEIVGSSIPRIKKSPIASSTPSRQEQLAGSLSLRELFVRRCRKCTNCVKPDCGRCASCLSNRESSGAHTVCFQKMCCEIPVDNKVQQMPPSSGFPAGFSFVIDPTIPGYNSERAQQSQKIVSVDGLKIFGGHREYYSVEGAKAHYRVALADASPEAFYKHIGALPGLSPSSSETNAAAGSEITLCCDCDNCTKDACGRCAVCRSNEPKERCLQKMCLKLPIDNKARPAVGFPAKGGWRFYFAKEEAYPVGSHHRYERVPGLFLLTEGGKTFRSVEAAVGCLKLKNGSKIARDFYNHVGLSPSRVAEPNAWQETTANAATILSRREVAAEPSTQDETRTSHNSVIGRKVRFAWNDITGQKNVVYGTITRRHAGDAGADFYTVTYDRASRARANTTTNGCGSRVPESQEQLRSELVLGGCVQYLEESRGSPIPLRANLRFFWRWINPDWRHEEMVVNDNGDHVPRLTLLIRGFELVFDVKPSSILNAGKGVFLTCTPAMGDSRSKEPFQLEAGELVDMGIYAPCRIQDQKAKASLQVKNFVHSSKCEEWAFHSRDPDQTLDITDDATGELHDIAKRLIHPYVNESNDESAICITAEHDAENCVHYLLGHSNKSQGKFVLPCHREIELFTHYAAKYEKVRVQKGYSTLPENEQEAMLKEFENEDVLDLKAMDGFEAEDVEAAVRFLWGLFSPRADITVLSESVVNRSLLCATVLERRADLLFRDAHHDGNLKRILNRARELVTLILMSAVRNEIRDKLVVLRETSGDVDGLLHYLLRQNYSHEQLELLGDMVD